MSDQHAKGPWVLRLNTVASTYVINDKHGDAVCSSPRGWTGQQQRSMQRIVVCVNACDGVDNETLIRAANEPCVVLLTTEFEEVVRERDDLLAAVKLACSHLDMDWLRTSHPLALEQIKQAISHVEDHA